MSGHRGSSQSLRLNGYEVARRIRSSSWGRSLMLIAVTGFGQDEDRQRAAQAGFDHHLTKPIDVQILEVLLSDLPHRREQVKA